MSGPKLFWIVVIALGVPAVGMSWIAWSVTGSVRADARLADAHLREVAWTLLAYADANDAFPLSEAELLAFAARPGGVPAELTKRAPGYPATRAEAMDSQASPAPTAPQRYRSRLMNWMLPQASPAPSLPAPALDECIAAIEIEWPTVRDVQPILRSKGKATLNGTLPTIGQWLFAMVERLRKG
jgi:hypothetical protein